MRRLILLLNFFLLMCLFSVQAGAIRVTSGGQLDRADAQSDTLSAVYVCNDFNNVTIEFTGDASSSTILTWYEYDNTGAVPTVIQGEALNTLKITRGDKGYIVNDGRRNYWVWVVDYQNYLKKSRSVIVDPANSDQCNELILNTTGLSMGYFAPLSTVAGPIDLQLSLKYNSMEFNESAKAYLQKEETVSLTPGVNFKTNGNIILDDTELPLMDTKFTVVNDRFARKWNLNSDVVSSVTYTAVKVEVKVVHEHDPLHNEDNNMVRGEDVGSVEGTAPFDIVFNAYANKPAATYFSWSVLDSLDNKITASTDESLRYTFESGKYKVNLLVTNVQNSCEASYSESIDVSESGLKVPNAFSPNGDAINDEFKVSYKSLTRFKAWIFNRWGVQLYYWTDPSKGWDGKVNGKYVSSGVYFYVIEATGSDGRRYKLKGALNAFSDK